MLLSLRLQHQSHTWNMKHLTPVVHRAHRSDIAPWKRFAHGQLMAGYTAYFSSENYSLSAETKIPEKFRSNTCNNSQQKENANSIREHDSNFEPKKKPLVQYYLCEGKLGTAKKPELTSRPDRGRNMSGMSEPMSSNLANDRHKGPRIRSVLSGDGPTSKQYLEDSSLLSPRIYSDGKKEHPSLTTKVSEHTVLNSSSWRRTHAKAFESNLTNNYFSQLRSDSLQKTFKLRTPLATRPKLAAVSAINFSFTKTTNPASKVNSSQTSLDVNKITDEQSLYDELFPEESIESVFKQKKAVERLERLPLFRWSSKVHKRRASEREENVMKTKNEEQTSSINRSKSANHSEEELSILSLNGCSSMLEESDFFRLGLKGDHIEAWKRGIIKVIPARDEVTLRFKGFYLILFSSSAAAEAYREQIIRLHQLSRAQRKSAPLPPTSHVNPQENEELATLLQNFSLVPGYGRLSLQHLKRPYGPRVKEALKDGGIVASLRHKTCAEYMVLFSLDMGTVSIQELCDFINNDGKRRNLHWNIAGGHKAIVDLNSGANSTDTSSTQISNEKKSVSKPSSFLLPFIGEYEARRFVRECHRQSFPLPGYSGNQNFPTINTEILW